jgi:hypothetical protein
VPHHLTGGDAWTAAFVLMALCEVTARLVTLYARGHLVARRGLLAHA